MNFIASIIWDISPSIIKFGGFEIRYYGLFFAIGFLLSYYIVQKFYNDSKTEVSEVEILTIYTVLGTVLGARFGHVFFYEPSYYFNNPSEILKIWHGGLASHGGVIGILISTALYSRKYKKKYLWVLDRISIPTALTAGLIRLGNLMNSEIYGTQTDLPWGFIFVNNGESIAKHPTQIYESLAYIVLFVILMIYYKRNKPELANGRVLGFFFIWVFSFRFMIEFIKNDQVLREANMLLNIGQKLSIPVIILGIYLIINSYRKKSAS